MTPRVNRVPVSGTAADPPKGRNSVPVHVHVPVPVPDLVLVLVLLLVLPAGQAHAQAAASRTTQGQAGPLDFEVTPAFGFSEFDPGWLGYHVEVRNRTQDEVRARVAIRADGFFARGASAFEAFRDEAFAAGSSKRFWLYVHPVESWRSAIRFEDDAGRLLAEETSLSQVAVAWGASSTGHPSSPLRMIALTRKEAGILNFLRSVALPNRLSVHVETPAAKLLPDRAIGYDPVDVVVLNDYPLVERLTPEQIAALREWVLAGGKLIVSPGQDAVTWLAQDFMKDLLPPGEVRVKETPRLEIDWQHRGGREAWTEPVLTVHLDRDADTAEDALVVGRVTVREDQPAKLVSLATRYRAGLGHVDLVALDVSGAPFRVNESFRDNFWGGLLAHYEAPRTASKPAVSGGRRRGGGQPPGSYYGAVSERVDPAAYRLFGETDLELPILGVSFLMLIYVATIGPLNFLLLKRAGREFAVLATIPALALAFTGIVFAVGYISKGARTTSREVAVLRTRAGVRLALEERTIALFPASSGGHDIVFERSEAGFALHEDHEALARAGLRIDERGAFAIRDYALGLWQLGCFRAESLRDLGGSIRTFVKPGGAGVEVVNLTGRRIAAALYDAAGGASFIGGQIEAGGGRAVLEPVVETGQDVHESALARRAVSALAQRALLAERGRGGSGGRLVAVVDPGPPREATEPSDLEERAAVLVVEAEAP